MKHGNTNIKNYLSYLLPSIPMRWINKFISMTVKHNYLYIETWLQDW